MGPRGKEVCRKIDAEGEVSLRLEVLWGFLDVSRLPGGRTSMNKRFWMESSLFERNLERETRSDSRGERSPFIRDGNRIVLRKNGRFICEWVTWGGPSKNGMGALYLGDSEKSEPIRISTFLLKRERPACRPKRGETGPPPAAGGGWSEGSSPGSRRADRSGSLP